MQMKVESRGMDIPKLFKSLSKAQRQKQASQGYLKLSDLTAAQRKMLGNVTGKGFEVRYNINGEQLVVKG